MSIQSNMIHSASSSENIYEHTLRNRNGMEVCILDYGATIKSLKIPMENGTLLDVVLGFENLNDYLNSFELPNPPYFGAIVGPIAGRISQARCIFQQKTINFDANHGVHQLHGGNENMSKHLWKLDHITDREEPTVTFRYFPTKKTHELYQNSNILLTYKLLENNILIVEILGKSNTPTLLNMTQHTYFNLDGHEENVVNQEIKIESEQILLVDNEQIPTGEIQNLDSLSGFQTFKKIPNSLDTTFILNPEQTTKVVLKSSKFPLQMRVETNQPCVHVYVGGHCFGQIKGKNKVDYHTQSGICFETQFPPNAPNIAHFPSIEIHPEKPYYHKTIFAFESSNI